MHCRTAMIMILPGLPGHLKSLRFQSPGIISSKPFLSNSSTRTEWSARREKGGEHLKPGVCRRADSAVGRRPRLIRGAASPLEVLPRAAVLVPGVGGGVAVRHAAADRRPAGRTHESPGAGGVDATPVQQRLRGRAARRIKLCYHKAQRWARLVNGRLSSAQTEAWQGDVSAYAKQLGQRRESLLGMHRKSDIITAVKSQPT